MPHAASDEVIGKLKTFVAQIVDAGATYRDIDAAITAARRGRYGAGGLREQEEFDVWFGQAWHRAIGQLLADAGFTMLADASVARSLVAAAGVREVDHATQFVARWTAHMQQGFAKAAPGKVA